MIDLRSDTVTKPTPAMLQAMMQARVGDDVYGDDPTVATLEKYAAELFGHQAAVFCPSGTMTNQIAINVYTRPGDEVICADNAHIFKYEGGGMAANSGVQARIVGSNRGIITALQVADAVNANDPHFPKSALVSIENTSNRGGGKCYTLQNIKDLFACCNQLNLPLHIDGARIFNAIIAKGYTAKEIGSNCHSISICLSKGLGAPVGSLLIGNIDFIAQSRRVRKRMGGGMRQAGYLAAAGLYALQHHVQRLENDHRAAQSVAYALTELSFVKSVMDAETNIVIFECENEQLCNQFSLHLTQHGIIANKISNTAIRFVFHLDITEEMVATIIAACRSFSGYQSQR